MSGARFTAASTAASPANEDENTAAENAERKRSRFVYQDDEAIEKPFNWAQMRRLLVYMKPYKRQLLPVLLVMMVLGTLTKLAIPFLISYAIDHAIQPADGNPSLRMLYMIAGTVFGLYIVQWGANAFRIKFMNVIGQRIIHDLRGDLFKHIQKLSFHFYDKRPAGSVLVRVTNDVNSLQELFTNGAVNTLIDCMQLAGIIIILLFLNVQLALAVMITVPIMFLVSTKLRKKIRFAWQDVRMKQSRINSHLNEAIQGVRVTQAYTQEKQNMEFFDHMNNVNKKSWDRASAMNQSFGPVIEITSAVGAFILFMYGSYLIQSHVITVGVLFAFAQYIGNFWEPINRLGQMYSQMLIAMASSERIFEFMDEQPSIEDTAKSKVLPPIHGDVEFENIMFEYEKGRPALKGISLSAKAGESIALVGHTGSGKSTIINLLCRFYDTTEGRVTIDGHDIKQVTIESLRSQVGIVLQDTFIFSGTIRDNIRFGRLDATDAEVEAAARAVYAHDFIVSMQDGYDTEVEERGNVLSMGQRQLISFARALLANPRILILDEATASIDTETELKIQEALKTLLQGRTSFIIAHRLSTIRNCDNIVVLDHGVIQEQGTHDQLMNLRGTYYNLVAAQYKYM
ncbi:ABC transporter ATP-binding protein/permease [Paenibacillus sp. MER 180]|uniref:ABC transporter ATP-binding protein n=1 Tax=unclassified Paenibacillus TaxID=185978 RepID=UPI0008064601|nr:MULTISPECIES: ABC transporter ATP-binding protein [unclassified Paenibacillus]MCM3289835.1 ABC transporter ATP-binding protein/permease [Paenibacillus sp. MER 180]OBY79699.1 multidrug ABC transporter ATP-binding protein [Paenibacillus sp. KS1]